MGSFPCHGAGLGCGLLAFVVVLWFLPADVSAGPASFDHGYRSYDALLRAHVGDDGLVNYDTVAKDRRLAAFVEEIATLAPEVLADWSRDQQIAFYINAYNALTLQTIVDAPGVHSVRDIKPDPWDNDRWKVAGRDVSLNFLEHTRLRRQLREVRVHFVLVCATQGSPKLPRRAIRPDRLGEQLDGYARAFVRDTMRNRIDRSGRKIYLSKIFHWYGEDFVDLAIDGTPAALLALSGREGASVRYVYSLLREVDRSFLEDGKFEVVYSEYDWSLNKR